MARFSSWRPCPWLPPPPRSPPPRPPPPRSPPPRPPPPRPPSTPPPPPPSSISPTVANYKEVLGLTFFFYEAQRLGVLPASNRVDWRGNSFLTDRVVGGYADAGDHIKPVLTMAQMSMFLAWSALDFQSAYVQAGQLAQAKAAVKWATDYIKACHISPNEYVGLIGDPAVDHSYWGRPEEYTGDRKAYIWTRTMAASDLLGMASSALSSASLLFAPDNATYSAELLATAKTLYNWGASLQGKYSDSYPSYNNAVYGSNRYTDKLMTAAAWLYKATSNSSYLSAAHSHYLTEGGRWSISPYVSYDSLHVPAVALLLDIGRTIGAANVPGHAEYLDFFTTTVMRSYINGDGTWGIVKTPLGMTRYNWSNWGNLATATSVAFMALIRAKQLPTTDANRAAYIAYARSQVDYALGAATGRSYVVGWGRNPPLRPHHRAASCPDLPAPCGWTESNSPDPNPQIIYGALVGGPAGPGDDTYYDVRSDYVTNEVALTYNSGLTGALAGLIELLGSA